MSNTEEWVKKCLSCKHCYRRKDDADTLYCRCRNGQCRYEEYKKKYKKR